MVTHRPPWRRRRARPAAVHGRPLHHHRAVPDAAAAAIADGVDDESRNQLGSGHQTGMATPAAGGPITTWPMVNQSDQPTAEHTTAPPASMGTPRGGAFERTARASTTTCSVSPAVEHAANTAPSHQRSASYGGGTNHQAHPPARTSTRPGKSVARLRASRGWATAVTRAHRHQTRTGGAPSGRER